MKKFTISALFFTLIAFGTGTATAVNDTMSHNVTITVNEVALLEVTPSIDFTIGAEGGEAGAAFYVHPNNGNNYDVGYDNSSYLQYTSIVAESGSFRNITVHIDDADNIPAGFKLYVKAAGDVTSGSGDLGTAQTSRIDLSQAVLSGASKIIVADMGSGYTENGATDGLNLIYELEMIDGDAGKLHAESCQAVITYTMTDSVAQPS